MAKGGSYQVEFIEVRSYFREGGKVVGTERCSNSLQAALFAKHQRKMFPYVEIVQVRGNLYPSGWIDTTSVEVIEVFR